MKLSLRNKFLIPTILLILVGMGVSTVVSYVTSRSALNDALTSQITQIVGSIESYVESWVGDRKIDISSWAEQKIYQTALQDSFVGKAARKSANTELAGMKEKYPFYENINIVNPKGDIIAASTDAIIGKINIADRKYFQAAMRGKQFVSDVLKSKATGNPVFIISSPIKEKEAIIGILSGVIDLTYFNSKFVDPVKIGKTGYGYMLNADGTVIAHKDKKLILDLNIKDLYFGNQMLSMGNGLITYTYEGVTKMTAFQTVPELKWIIAAGVPTEELLAPAKKVGIINIFVALCVVAAASVIVYLIARSVANPINRISKGLYDGAAQVASASKQVSSSSQSLAEGASEQAASLEETSSSLEEMASMTKQNAENATQADRLMQETNQVVGRANDSMVKLTASMQDISHASEETSKIIKTIDEIAFQTNLLALNAAVEAARAGEAGAGFAVVADEVRNLAMRAADAAKNTADLIEGTVKKVKEGSELVEGTAGAFLEVAQSSQKVGELVTEISAASNEQSEGIDQVSRAMNEMDKVVQQNAANAEESASASEEMNAQAAQMHDLVIDMQALVSGVKARSSRRESMGNDKGNGTAAIEQQQRKHSKKGVDRQGKAIETAPDKVIPFEDDMADF